MKIYRSQSTDPYFNLATEEFFLKNSIDDLFMIYTNATSIVVGKHQNALAEINSCYCHENDIKVARRLSGGGTVFHDAGNVNFSIIQTVSGTDMINYQKFASPIKESLQQLGLDVQFSERNDLIIDGLKISGSAMHVFKQRVLAHGTLLFNADLEKLSNALKNSREKYTDKAIKSVKSKVANLGDYLAKMKINGLIEHLIKTVGNNNSMIDLDKNDISLINKQIDNKYLTFDWVFGYSPKYQFATKVNAEAEIVLHVEKGIIQQVDLKNAPQENSSIQLLSNYLVGKKHEFSYLIADKYLQEILESIPEYNLEKFCAEFF